MSLVSCAEEKFGGQLGVKVLRVRERNCGSSSYCTYVYYLEENRLIYQ